MKPRTMPAAFPWENKEQQTRSHLTLIVHLLEYGLRDATGT